MLEARIVVGEESVVDKEISDLEKEATEYSKSDLDRAIQCLQKVKLLRKDANTIPAYKSYLRLPKFLYKAGRLSEAMTEYHKLILNAQNQNVESIQKMSYYTDELHQSMLKRSELVQLAQIYEQMSKVYKKEKDLEKEAHYYDLYVKCSDDAESLIEVNENEKARLWSNHRKAIELKRQSKQ